MDHVDKVCMPGDVINNVKQSEATKKAFVGPGLRQEDETVVVCKPGVFRFREPNVYWIDSHEKRYVPVKGDFIIGIVTAKAGDIFRVDVAGSELATLSYLAFEGATKKNRPDVKVGDIVYARFLLANKDIEPELVCIDGQGRSNGMGVIRDGGYMFQCSLNLVRKILHPKCVLAKTLGKQMPYEITVGINGRVWVKGRSMKETIAVMNAVSASEHMTNSQIKAMCKKLGDALTGF